MIAFLLGAGNAGVVSAQDIAEPSGIGEAVTAGPWSMTVQQVLLGDEAGADERNGPVPDGYRYVAAEIAVTNQASQPFVIDAVDFAIADSTGYLRRATGIFPPDPALEGSVAPGEGLSGWILGIAADGGDLVLIYDSATISGDWADHAFALANGASLEPSQERAAELNRDGRTPDSAVGPDALVSTSDWTVRLVDIVSGPAVYDISPDGTRRLADSYRANGYDLCLDNWIAFSFEVTNNGGDGQTRYLSPTAIQLAHEDGSPVEDVRTLSPPAPDVAGAYLAGATRTGWVSVELPNFCEADAANLIYDGTLLRFQPSVSTDDIRYLTWGEGGATSAPNAEPFDPDTTVPAGAIAVTTDAGVRMRQEPSTEGEIVVELNVNVEVEITGEPEEGDGYVWYPVRVVESGEEGWIVQDFLGTVE